MFLLILVLLTESNNHQDSRNAKSQWIAGVVAKAVDILSQDRRQRGGNERAGVDGEVEHGEELLELAFLVRQNELVTAERGYARFDSSCSSCYDC